MDPHEKDETALHRQEALARRIGRALDQMDSTSAAACPDAEILAAYAERGLNSEETAKWEGHFSTCSRCRKILRVLDASADTPLADKEVARLGEMVAAATSGAAGARTPSRLAWPRLSDWRVRWLAPALGVAAVLLVFLALRKNWHGAEPAQTPVLVALAPKQEPSPPAASLQGAPRPSAAPLEQRQALRAQEADRLSSTNALNTVPSNLPADESAKRKVQAVVPPAGASASTSEAESALQADKRLGATQAEREQVPGASPAAPSVAENQTEATPPVPAAPPPPAKPAPSMEAAQRVQLDASANAASSTAPNPKQTVAGRTQPAPSAGGAQARAQASSEGAAAAKKQAFALAAPFQQNSALLKAPLGSTVWRAGAAGKIERSVDGGMTWAAQPSPSQEDWLAGSAISGSVCWLVGRHGAIAFTLDGEHWELVPPPLQATGANGTLPDWTGIAATDAQNVTITTGDGRGFTTSDGGRTWRQAPQK